MHEKGTHPVAVLWISWIILLGVGGPWRCPAGEADAGQPQAADRLHLRTPLVTSRQTVQRLDLALALFVENRGQWADGSVRYAHDGNPVDVAVRDSGILFQVGTPPLRFFASFLGARPVRPVGRQRSDTVFNYCTGDPASWRTGVASFEKVLYPGLYEGIDLHVWGLRSRIKYEFRVAPGADYRQIVVRYEGIEGLSLRQDGSLLVDLGGQRGTIRDEAPCIYQEIGGRQVELAGRFVLDGERTYSFAITGQVNPDYPLVIDPNLAWSTHLGGSGNDYATDVAADAAGNVYVAGWTDSPGWASGGYDTEYEGSLGDGFVAKLSGAGAHLWTTYVGGSMSDSGRGITVDGAGNVYAVGYTTSDDWIRGGYDTHYEPNEQQDDAGDGYVIKLSSAGTHLWSSYLGGGSYDVAEDVAVDAATGDVYVAGTTRSTHWASGGFHPCFNGGLGDLFLVKLTAAGDHLWSTCVGGALRESNGFVAIGDANSVYVTGTIESPRWADRGFDTTLDGPSDAFVAKLTGTGQLQWSTYLGGTAKETAAGIAVDGAGAVYAGGSTNSPDWVRGGFDTTLGDSFSDGYLVKLTSAGDHVWSTYLGAGNGELADDLCVDLAGNVYAVGDIYVGDGEPVAPWINGGFDTTFNGGSYDGYLVKLTSSGTHAWSSFVGGTGDDGVSGVATSPAGAVFVVGGTASAGWTGGGFDTTLDGQEDAFVLKIADGDAGATPTGNKTPVHRFWSAINSRHFYTISESEKQNLIDNFSHVWTYEGIAYYTLVDGTAAGSLPVYRFWSPSASAHFYTITESEKDMLIRDFPHVWTYEGIAFYAYPERAQPAETTPVYRFWSGANGCHFYTMSESERDMLIRDFPHVWTFEGIAWYAYPP